MTLMSCLGQVVLDFSIKIPARTIFSWPKVWCTVIFLLIVEFCFGKFFWVHDAKFLSEWDYFSFYFEGQSQTLSWLLIKLRLSIDGDCTIKNCLPFFQWVWAWWSSYWLQPYMMINKIKRRIRINSIIFRDLWYFLNKIGYKAYGWTKSERIWWIV